MSAIFSLQVLEEQARRVLGPERYDFFAGGAEEEVTLRENVLAFERIALRPRVLRGESCASLETELLGERLSMPIVVAPTAFQCLAHTEGESATARAVRAAGTLMIVSMAATQSLEQIVAASAPDGARRFWFQLYLQRDRSFTEQLIRRAEAAGYSALAVTVDSPVFGHRHRDLRNGFTDLPEGLHCANMKLNGGDGYQSIDFDPTLTWRDIDWLRGVTTLPIVVKGIGHPADARLAIEHGCAAIVVSNHGGRQLDSMAASIDLLPPIAAAVNGAIPIVLDGGIRRGTDVLKALACGASAVAVGRPVLWGLAIGGEVGVSHVLNFLQADLRHALVLCGCRSLAELASADLLVSRRPV